MKTNLDFSRRALALFACALLASVARPTAAHAQLAFDVTGGVMRVASVPGTVGYTFNVLTPVFVTELDAYVGFGFTSPTIPVGIFDSAGNLLTSAPISVSSPDATTPSANGGNFVGATLSPLALPVGTYTIAEFVGKGSDTASIGGSIIADPAVSYGHAVATRTGSASLVYPMNNYGAGAYFGPSFKFTPAATPEPGSIALLIGMGVTGAGVLRRRRK